jgi:hypothetical protein
MLTLLGCPKILLKKSGYSKKIAYKIANQKAESMPSGEKDKK